MSGNFRSADANKKNHKYSVHFDFFFLAYFSIGGETFYYHIEQLKVFLANVETKGPF
jgi:hypothetical protein